MFWEAASSRYKRVRGGFSEATRKVVQSKMPMPIKVRESFRHDANYVERLKTAIDLDESRDPEWRKKAIEACINLTILLREADIARMKEEGR